MTALKSADVLEREHEVIQRVVASISVLADRFEQAHPVDWTLISAIGEFFREYADRLHHAKEEQALFPMLERRGVPVSGCPLAALRHEHELGRALVSELGDMGVPGSDETSRRERLISLFRRLVKLYVEHIWKEDYLLMPMSAKVLSIDDDEALVREFENINAGSGSAERQEFERFAANLDRRVVEGDANA